MWFFNVINKGGKIICKDGQNKRERWMVYPFERLAGRTASRHAERRINWGDNKKMDRQTRGLVGSDRNSAPKAGNLCSQGDRKA